MSMVSSLMIPEIVIKKKKNTTNFPFRILISVKTEKVENNVWILTPNLQKLENVKEFKLKHQENNEFGLYIPVEKDDNWNWNYKVENINVSIYSIGGAFGSFMENDEVESWSIITKWFR